MGFDHLNHLYLAGFRPIKTTTLEQQPAVVCTNEPIKFICLQPGFGSDNGTKQA